MSNDRPDAQPSLRERLQTFRRQRRPMAWILGLGALLTVLLASFLPPTYRATATILIEQQEIPQDLVRSTITSFADQRVQVISQRVMTTQNLMQIIERHDLYPWQRRTRPREVVIERMRDDIRMKLISANVMDPRSGRATQATIAFTVSYDNRSPDLALKVANELTSLYLNENLTSRAQAAQQTATFLTREGVRLSAEIAVLGEKLAAFKERNVEALPEFGQVNFQLLDRAEMDLRDVGNRLGSLEEQRVLLEAQLAQMSPTSQIFTETGQRILSPEDRLKLLRAELASLRSRYAPDHPDIRKAEREVAGLAAQVRADDGANDLLRQLEDARGQLATASQRYSPEHPDVQRLERVVATIEGQLAAAPTVARVREARTNPDNPAYIQLRAQLDAVLAERTAMQRKDAELRARIGDYQRRLAVAPEVEKEYRALARDYENAQLQYQQVRAKQTEAEVAQNLETERKGERFTLIEPPLPPETPVSPNRPVVLVLGLLASAGLALLVMGIREALDTTVRGARDLAQFVEVPPLAAIPVIETEADRARQARGVRRSLQAAVGAVVLAIAAVHFLYRPLDILWLTLLRRLGA